MIETVAAVVTAIGVVFAGLQVRSAKQQRIREFENLYVQRYWTLMDQLPADVFGGSASFDSLTERQRHALVMYVRLCEDQLEMGAQGAFTSSTLKIWTEGMKNVRGTAVFESAMEVAVHGGTSRLVMLGKLRGERRNEIARDGAPGELPPGRPGRTTATPPPAAGG